MDRRQHPLRLFGPTIQRMRHVPSPLKGGIIGEIGKVTLENMRVCSP